MSFEPERDFGPLFYRLGLDPTEPHYVAAKAEKLVQRGPREYYLVGRKPDGTQVEARLTNLSFRMA